jgi:hypothetical protein
MTEQSETNSPQGPVKLQILIRKPWRNDEGIRCVRALAEQLGMTITLAGAATLSAEMPAKACEELFGTTLTPVASRPPGQSDFGRTGGYASGELPVPAQLEKYVENISVAPPHIRL